MIPSWIAFVLTFALSVAVSRLAWDGRRRRHPTASRSEWTVRTVPADKAVKVSWSDHYDAGNGTLQLSRSVLVRVERDKQSLTIAALDIGDEDFEEKISDAQAKAQAKAASLNAYVGVGS
jgi:hypothetical protein